jgi:hypothetical protein
MSPPRAEMRRPAGLVAVDAQEGEGGDGQRTKSAREVLGNGLHVSVCGYRGGPDHRAHRDLSMYAWASRLGARASHASTMTSRRSSRPIWSRRTRIAG